MKKKLKPTGTNLMDLADFYSADAEILRIKYKQLENLIGSRHHPLSDGIHCEALLKEFLRRTLPQNVAVDSGFIRRVSDVDWSRGSSHLSPNSPISTSQLDVVIHDTANYAPLFRSEDFVVVLPQAVQAIIEVKKSLVYKELKNAVAKIGKTRQLLRRWRIDSDKVFTCIFAFSLGDNLITKCKLYSDSFERLFEETVDEFDGVCEAPDLVMALPRFALHQSRGTAPSFYYCPTAPADKETPNTAGQFLLFLLNHYTNWGTQGRAHQYPESMMSSRKLAFKIKVKQ